MAKRSVWWRLSAGNFNLEQFRSELADETQIAAALPEDARVGYLSDATQAGLGEGPAHQEEEPDQQDLEEEQEGEPSPD